MWMLLTSLTFAATIEGQLTFYADYAEYEVDSSPAPRGLVPDGRSPLPGLYVCAYDAVGVMDVMLPDDLPSLHDDQLIGCTSADEEGNYAIDVPVGVGRPEGLYLMTELCDGPSIGEYSEAEICVRLDQDEGDKWAPANRKVIWSYSTAVPQGTSSVTMDWNLSCPDDPLSFCYAGTEPDGMIAGDECACDREWYQDCENICDVDGTCGDTNSRTGCNKEAVHAYRASYQPILRFGSQKPTSSNTFDQGVVDAEQYCPDSDYGKGNGPVLETGVSTYCDAPECQDEMQAHVTHMRRDGEPDPVCVKTEKDEHGHDVLVDVNNMGRDYDQYCVKTTDEPFRVVHEQGHTVDRRWRASTAGADGQDLFDMSQRRAMREGFANLYGASAWFVHGATEPVYCGGGNDCLRLEPDAPAIDLSRREVENAVTRVLWDLYDSHDDGASETESERWSPRHIRNTLSAFHSGADASLDTSIEAPGGADEDDRSTAGTQHGANFLDFAYWWHDKRGATADGLCSSVSRNGLDTIGLLDTLVEGDFSWICP